MKRCKLVLRLCCLLLAALLLWTGCAVAENAELDQQLDKLLRKTTGAIITVAKDGEIVYEHAWGYANKRTGEKNTPEHYFNVASVTKLVTGIGMMRLVEAGQIELDASIGDAIGFEIKNLYYPKIPVTLRHIMSHTSSLRAMGGYTKSKYRLDDFLPASLGRKSEWQKREPGSKYEYSNFGAGLMGTMIEQVTGQNINDYMKEAVFDPLGMDAAYHASLLGQGGIGVGMGCFGGSLRTFSHHDRFPLAAGAGFVPTGDADAERG